ncbi:hypothetical protein PL716_05520 [Bifidobacterium bifidum]|uniref:hypothetical protein n=1 Tax=Bifidobacterium bifidum TaxID=1681 RepID=UPI001484EB26|nr:hypothetical protein [Bifidobacterium bifidum]MDB1208235.1 hypothetical protein [Bifidobacterium bifidum]MDB1211355.1 hypothetical protein [Bifidobacterium bifidum]
MARLPPSRARTWAQLPGGGKTSAADSLAHTGIDMSLVTVLAMAMLAAGITLERLRRMTR